MTVSAKDYFKTPPPEALLDLERHVRAMDMFMLGLSQHYYDCVVTGRTKQWADLAHGLVDMMVSGLPPFEHRLAHSAPSSPDEADGKSREAINPSSETPSEGAKP